MAQPNTSLAELARTNLDAPSAEQGAYCTECIDNVLHFKDTWSQDPVDCTLHNNVPELVACGKHCLLCGYICSLFEQRQLDKMIELSQKTSNDPSNNVNIHRMRGYGHGNYPHHKDRANCWLLRVQIHYEQSEKYEAEFTVYLAAGMQHVSSSFRYTSMQEFALTADRHRLQPSDLELFSCQL